MMKNLNWLLIAGGLALWLPMAAQAANDAVEPAGQDATPGEEQQAAAPKCLQAAVNPVTGHAVCVNPRGAPVDSTSTSVMSTCSCSRATNTMKMVPILPAASSSTHRARVIRPAATAAAWRF